MILRPGPPTPRLHPPSAGCNSSLWRLMPYPESFFLKNKTFAEHRSGIEPFCGQQQGSHRAQHPTHAISVPPKASGQRRAALVWHECAARGRSAERALEAAFNRRNSHKRQISAPNDLGLAGWLVALLGFFSPLLCLESLFPSPSPLPLLSSPSSSSLAPLPLPLNQDPACARVPTRSPARSVQPARRVPLSSAHIHWHRFATH